MSTEEWGTFLAFLCAPAASMFWLLYGTTAPWWKTWSGRAVITSKLGLAVLVDAAVVSRWTNSVTWFLHDQVVITAFGLLTVGTWLYLVAFAREQYVYRNAPKSNDESGELN